MLRIRRHRLLVRPLHLQAVRRLALHRRVVLHPQAVRQARHRIRPAR